MNVLCEVNPSTTAMKVTSLQCVFVGVFRECVCADALVVLDFLSDLANLWSVEDVENSYCILDGYSRELIHASACVGLYSTCPVLLQLIVLHISALSLCAHTDILTYSHMIFSLLFLYHAPFKDRHVISLHIVMIRSYCI